MDEPNGTPPIPDTVQLTLPPAKGHIIISLLLDDTANFQLFGACLTPMIAHWLLEQGQDAVKAAHREANKPRVVQPGPRPGPGLPGWRPPHR